MVTMRSVRDAELILIHTAEMSISGWINYTYGWTLHISLIQYTAAVLCCANAARDDNDDL